VGFAEHGGDLQGSVASAEVVVPLVIDWLHPRSVLDVGCGFGAWMQAFLDAGVPSVHGVDSGSSDELTVDAGLYTQHDLRDGAPAVADRFDLVVCLELAEHLPATAARRLIDSLCQISDRVLFSAAIPGQGGPRHINEQRQSYWANLFAEQGFAPYDRLRSQIWADDRVSWWYRQNILLYAPERVMGDEAVASVIDVVHPDLFDEARQVRRALRASLRQRWPVRTPSPR
jgi:SAM-dependent methyltransferase